MKRDWLLLPPVSDNPHVMKGGKKAAEYLAKKAAKFKRAHGMIGELPAAIMAEILCVTPDALDALRLPHASIDKETGERLWNCAMTEDRFDRFARHDTEEYRVPPLVYFLRIAGKGPVKIGVAQDVGKRISGIQTSHTRPVRVIGTEAGGRRRERQLHYKFAHLRVRGEWFKATPELLRYIDDVMNWEHPRVAWERSRYPGRRAA